MFGVVVWRHVDGQNWNSLLQAVLNDNAQVDKGDNARLSSFVGAIAIADLVKTTLGPKGQRGGTRVSRGGGGRDTQAVCGFRWLLGRVHAWRGRC